MIFLFPLFCLSSFFFWIPYQAFAYPEMVRHGYVHCSTCHFSVSGGDLVTAYGRALGREVFAKKYSEPAVEKPSIEEASAAEASSEEVANEAASTENPPVAASPSAEEDSLDWFRGGLNLRLLQTYLDNSQVTRGRFMVMQLDVDAALIWQRWKTYFSIGRFEPKLTQTNWTDYFYSPRHWVSFDILNGEEDDLLILKAGRFLPAYGVMIPEHAYVTRTLTQLGPGQERKAIELAWIRESIELILTRIEGRYKFSEAERENGWAFQGAVTATGRSKIGLNSYRTKLEGEKKTAMDGLFLLVAWSELWSSLFQVDRLYLPNGKNGALNLLKLDYQWRPKTQIFFTQEYANTDIEKTEPHFRALGAGFKHFFRANIDLMATFRAEKNTAVLNEESKVFWLILHWSEN